jgi:DNA (cytosine-5)-methyltransferase 1
LIYLLGGVPTKDMGPINEWWVSGFDGGDEALLGFSTCYAEYYLMQASASYAPFMNEVRLKSFMSKSVIEFLLENHEVEHSYEDLLNYLQVCTARVMKYLLLSAYNS